MRSRRYMMSSFIAHAAAESRSTRDEAMPVVPRLLRASKPPTSVLWVDDDERLNRFAARLLQDTGLQIVVATSVGSAMAELAERAHCAIVLDLRLPDLPGLEALRRTRESDNTTPVIVLTGFGSTTSAIEALSLGAIDYQLKPARSARIMAALRIAARVGKSRPLSAGPQLVTHPTSSIALLSVLFNAAHADEHQLQTQLAWAAADTDLSFGELVAAIQALRCITEAPGVDETTRSTVTGYLTRALETDLSGVHADVAAFVDFISPQAGAARSLTDEGIAGQLSLTLPRLSRLVYEQFGTSPHDCRLIHDLQPALQQLAHTDEQIAQVAYRLGYAHASAFDRSFRRLLKMAPTSYRRLLTGELPFESRNA